MKRLITVVFAVLMAAALTFGASATELIRDENGKRYALDENGERITGLCFIDLGDMNKSFCRFDEDGFYVGRYTGWTKTASGKRAYYDSGKQLFGWNKIGKDWYHFNENGKADTGRVEICGGYYTFDDSGKWTGKRSSSAKRPDDFAVRFGYSIIGVNGFDTAEKTVTKDMTYDGIATKSASFSARDLQALYCAYLESGFSEMDSSIAYDWEYGLDKAIAAGLEHDYWSSEPSSVFHIEVTCNGTTSKISGEYEIQQITSVDETANRLWNFVLILAQYRDGLPAFQSFPEAEPMYD